jgi:hypothetical protein
VMKLFRAYARNKIRRQPPPDGFSHPFPRKRTPKLH